MILFFMFEKRKMKSKGDSSLVPVSAHKKKKRRRQSIVENESTEVQHCSRSVVKGDGLQIGAIETEISRSVSNGEKQHKKKKHRVRDSSSCTENNDAAVNIPIEVKQEMSFSEVLKDAKEKKKKKKEKKRKKKEKHFRQGDDSLLLTNAERSDNPESSEVGGEIPIIKRKKKRKKQMDGAATPQAKDDGSEVLQISPKKRRRHEQLELKTTVEENWQDESANCAETPRKTSKKHRKKHKLTEEKNEIEDTPQLSSTACQETLESPTKKHKKKRKAIKLRESGEDKDSQETDTVQCSPIKSKPVTTPEDNIHTKEGLPDSNHHQKKKKKKKKKKKHKESVGEKSITYEQTLAEIDPDLTELKMEQSIKAMVEQLREFMPSVRTMSNDTIRSMFRYDLPRFKTLKEEGIPIRQGRYTKEENEQIQTNLKELMLVTGIENEWEFFQPPESFEDLLRIKRLKIKHLFCVKLAEGIARPWKSVYQRARKLYDPHRCKGRYTEEELKKFKRLMAVHGNHWQKIAGGLERSDLSVMCRARIMKDSLKNGPWSKQEERKFMKIMKKVITKRVEKDNCLAVKAPTKDKLGSILREKLYKGLPWLEISNLMEERHWIQCRKKWMQILSIKMSKGSVSGRGRKTYPCKINLIKRLYMLNVDDDSEVDWEQMCDAVGNVPPQFVQTMFYKLKARHVPSWHRKTFGEIVDFLNDKIRPKYEEKLKKKATDSSDCSTEAAVHKPLKRVFQLSDIFNSDNDDSDLEDEEDEEDEDHKAHPAASKKRCKKSSRPPAARKRN
uniref:Transcription termination factor 1 n=1 Tax=Callorhinchus milii TaxID=7868 RepID=A0A4W3IPN4_CALMI